jgi:hypothetical protein
MGTDREPPQDSSARMRQPGGRTGADMSHVSFHRQPYRQASPSQRAAIRVTAGHPRRTPGSPSPREAPPAVLVWDSCSSHRSHHRQPDSRARVEVNRPTVSGRVRRSTGVWREIVRKPTRGAVSPDNHEGPLTGKRAGQRPFSPCGRCSVAGAVSGRCSVWFQDIVGTCLGT